MKIGWLLFFIFAVFMVVAAVCSVAFYYLLVSLNVGDAQTLGIMSGLLIGALAGNLACLLAYQMQEV